MSLVQMLQHGTDGEGKISSVIPWFMIRNIIVSVNNSEVGRFPELEISQDFNSYLTFVNVLYNVLDRPIPNAFRQVGRFLPCDISGDISTKSSWLQKTNQVFWFDNSMVYENLLLHPMNEATSSTATAKPLSFTRFPLGLLIGELMECPQKWLTWGNNIEIELELWDPRSVSDYCFFANPEAYKASNPVWPKLTIEYSADAFATVLVINDQSGRLFRELNDVLISMTPLVYRKPDIRQFGPNTGIFT